MGCATSASLPNRVPQSLAECLQPLIASPLHPNLNGLLTDALQEARRRPIRHPQLTVDSVACLLLYTAEGFYQEVNGALRGEKVEELPEFTSYLALLKNVFQQLPPMHDVLYRCIRKAVGKYENAAVGLQFKFVGITSCSREPQWQFLDSTGVLFRIFPKGHSAVDVADYSFYPAEAECILFPGTMLEVTAKDWIPHPVHGHNILRITVTAEDPALAHGNPVASGPPPFAASCQPHSVGVSLSKSLSVFAPVTAPAQAPVTADEQQLLAMGFTDVAHRSLLGVGYSLQEVTNFLA